MVRAYRITMTPPMEPVAISLDGHLQEHAIKKDQKLVIPKVRVPVAAAGDSGAVKELAEMLVKAESPVIVADRLARTAKGQGLLVAARRDAERPRSSTSTAGRTSPTATTSTSRSAARTVIGQADVIIGLELTDFWGTVNSFADTPHQVQRSIIKAGTKLVSITALDLYIRANYQDFQRFQQVDLAIAADAEATLPVADRGGEAGDDRRKPRSRAERRGAALRKAAADIAERNRANADARLGREPDLDGAHVGRDLERDQGRGLGAGLARQPAERVAAPAVELRQAAPVHRRLRRRGRRLRPAGRGRRRARPSRARPPVRQHPAGRRRALCAGRAVDGGLSQDPDADGDAQQPRLSPGGDARAAHGQLAPARHATAPTSAPRSTTPRPNFAKLAEVAGRQGRSARSPIPRSSGPTLKKAVPIVKAGEPVLIDVVSQPR